MSSGKLNKTEKFFTIPINDIAKLAEYEQGIRALLRRIEVGKCDPELMQHIKSVYELLDHLKFSYSSAQMSKHNDVMLQS
jgi:predicted transcriptional regulator